MALGIELPLDIVRCRNHSGDVGGSPSGGVAEGSFAIPPLEDIDDGDIPERILDDHAIPPLDHIDPP